MWKTQMFIAISVAIIEWVLFLVDLLFINHFNTLVFMLAVLWSTWSIFTTYKYLFYERS